MVVDHQMGTPQGGPLSPLLANVLLDEWLRHRLRAIQLKHWRRSRTIYRELKALGTSEDVAKQVAVNSRRWWRNSNRLLKTVLTIAYFDSLGVPRLS